MPIPSQLVPILQSQFGRDRANGLTLRLKPTAGLYTTSAGIVPAYVATDPVGRWEDQSGESHHVTQPTAGARPLITSDGTYPAVVFSGTKYLNSASFIEASYDKAFTAITVEYNRGTGLQVQHASDALGHYMAVESHRSRFYVNSTLTNYYGPGETYAFGIRAVRYDGANVKLYWQSRNMHGVTSSARTAALGVTGVLSVGALSNGGYAWTGDLYRLDLYRRALTDGEMTAAIAGYMAAYGVVERSKLVLCWGDSLTLGLGMYSVAYPVQLRTALGATWGVANCGYSSQTIVNMDGYKTTDIQPCYDAAKTKNIAIVWLGTNDIYFGATGATAYTNYKALCAALQSYGFYVIAVTMIKRSTFDATQETHRGTFNTSLMAETLASSGAFDARIDPASDANLQNTSDTTYYGDGTHLTGAGYAIVAGLAATAVAAA